MEEYLLVDGYNIIGAWPELNRLKDSSLEDARDRLIEMLADYQGFSGKKVIIVFDAYRVPGLGKKYRQRKLQVLYTKEKETADECIERQVALLTKRGRQIYVATSDFVEQHVTFGIGALRVPARELLISVEASRRDVREKLIRQKESSRSTFEQKLSSSVRDELERWRRGE